MKFNIFCVVGLLVFLFLLGTTQSQQQRSDHENGNRHGNSDEPKVVTDFEKKIWNVVANLYKEAIKTEHENVIFSPLSLTTSMVMLNSGAGGETAREIQNLFQFGTNSEFTIRNQTQVLNSLKNQAADRASGVEFLSASRIYANSQNAMLRQNYVREVKTLGEVETLDFAEPRKVVDDIKEWAKNQTQGKISEVVKDEDFNVDTAVVLLDTLYFKAPWKQPFNKNRTKWAVFHVSENETEQVEMMSISAQFPHVDLQEVEASAVFLPYKEDRFNMIIYLPWKGRKLSTLEEKLETLVPSQVLNEATTTEISLHLPKFRISSSLDLNPILTSLGVGKMFKEEEADFSRMSESAQFHVSKVRQYVFMEVNEDGAEEVNGIESLAAPKTVKMDRPFIFQIYDRITGAVLLSGRISNPNERNPFRFKGWGRGRPTACQFDDGVNWPIVMIGVLATLFVILLAVAVAFFVRDILQEI